jgi:MFS family permease
MLSASAALALKYAHVQTDLVNFGLVKAVMNFVTGLLADRYGRRWTMLIGWVVVLPMPLAVLSATSWAQVSATNLLLGLQQAICWSTSIFIMLDYAGKENGGLAVGLNETSGMFRCLRGCMFCLYLSL